MSRITVRRKHKLGHVELRDRVSHLAERLGEKYGADCTWDGDTVHIDHSNVTGDGTCSPIPGRIGTIGSPEHVVGSPSTMTSNVSSDVRGRHPGK